MKPDVLSLGSFPDATMAELSQRFMLHHFVDFTLPPPGLTQEVAQRIRAIATEANRGANRALIEMLPKHNTDHGRLTRHVTVYTVEADGSQREAKAFGSSAAKDGDG